MEPSNIEEKHAVCSKKSLWKNVEGAVVDHNIYWNKHSTQYQLLLLPPEKLTILDFSIGLSRFHTVLVLRSKYTVELIMVQMIV